VVVMRSEAVASRVESMGMCMAMVMHTSYRLVSDLLAFCILCHSER
jgi:hypothetical protein